MKRYFKYIFLALIAALLTVSCLEELELETPVIKNDVLTLVPRVQSFANRYVTKAEYSTDEAKISTLAVLVFNEDGTLIHHQENVSVNSNKLTLNRSLLNSPAQEGKLDNATVVLVANIGLADLKNGRQTLLDNIETLTLAGMENYTYSPAQTVITSIGDGFTGFPMIGGTSADLTLASSVNALEVNLKILYAKIIFEIAVTQGTENEGTGMQFALSGCTVHNTANTIPLAIPASEGKQPVDFLGNSVPDSEIAKTDGATPSGIGYNTATAGTALGATGTATFSDNSNPNDDQKVKFTFYILESRYNHGSNLKGIYPSDDWLTSIPAEDVKGYNADTDQDKLNGVKYFYDDRIQQYKPKLAGTGKATYVTLKGTYKDYLGTSWNVDYKVYLGKDNAQNFHVDRNSEYTNLITIKGIRNRQEGAYGENDVWIDHRVNVSYSGNGVNDHVTITRETLLDAHIEVRPLRVKWENNEFDGVRIYLPTKSDGSLVDWIGIERFTGNNNADGSTYCLIDDEANPGKKKSSGKRKYFTTDLISELQTKEGEYGVRVDEDTKKAYIYLLDGDCAWIYFDENLGSSDRQADIKLEFYTPSGSTKEVVYKVKQRCLQTVGGYAIESYEEYLHSYDSADKYNLSTSPVDYTQQGLAWGFQNHKLSQNILVSSTTLSTTSATGREYLNQMFKLYSYDYFHQSDGSSYNLYTKTSGSWGNASFGTGLDFTDRASANRDIAVRDMGTMPENAYQYCLSKNKFEVVGMEEVRMTLNWYLPDTYEMQAILAASQSDASYVDIDADAFYWSSQPSFDTELVTFINEDIENARAVSAQGISDLPRKNQNRIRCVYAKQGITLDEEAMEDRVPDGIGGNYNVVMKAWDNGSFGYFNYLLPAATKKESSSDWVYNDNKGTNYPNKDNAGSISGEKFKYIKTTDKDNNPIEGFDINPGETSSWTEYQPVLGSPDGYYTTLATYPGLTEFTLTKRTIGEAYKPSTTPKSGTQTETIKFIKVLDKKLPSASDLRTFDHLRDGNMINISFDQSKGTTLPAFVYDELASGTTTTNTRTWIRPKYNLKEYPLDPKTYTKNANGEGSETGISTGTSRLQQASENSARQNAFDGTTDFSTLTNRVEGAYPKAKNDALAKLNEILKDYPVSEGWEHSKIQCTELKWNVSDPNISWTEPEIVTKTSLGRTWIQKVTITCTVKVTASVTVSKPSVGEVFVQVDGTGRWGDPVPKSTDLTPAINTDEMRMYCGNSFTISLSEAAKQQGYEITRVKVHYSGNNHMGEYNATIGLGGDNIYARFVNDDINLSDYKLLNQFIVGSTAVLQLPGMDYSADGINGWHQWTGEGRNSLTLVLADYNVDYNKGSLSYSYYYDTDPKEPAKYIIVDQIEVKCTKRKNATFDFKQIYTEGGNIETSYCTVKHITFTAEGGTEDNPSGATAEGLKLYAGSKVTFKALDGYVINNISGDESLTFKGSKQTVEFTGLPEKTITAPIVVLYSKAATETN